MKSGLIAFAAVAGLVAINIILPGSGASGRLATFIATAFLIITLMAAIGDGIKKRAAGIIIDNRNRVSLSKLQATAWSVLILAALITVAAIRLRLGLGAALDIEIGPDLLIVMGISAASMVATPALLSLKTATPPEADEVIDALKVGDVQAEGKVHGRPDASEASWLDVFRGDEVSNASSPDLSKVQQFLITGLLLVYYAILVGQMCWDGDTAAKLSGLPTFNKSMLWLLGISHAGYLGYKAAPHSGPATAGAPLQEVG